MTTLKFRSQTIGILFFVLGAVAFFASFLLTYDKIELLKNPSYIPPCNISPFISCGSVMATPQAEVLGFPNSLVGMGFYAAIAAVGVALLAGATFHRWFWLGLQITTSASAVFVFWLAYQSIFKIGTLCPYCMVVWAATIPLALYVKVYNMRAGHMRVSSKLAAWVGRYHWALLLFFYAIIIVPIIWKYWWYWSGLFA